MFKGNSKGLHWPPILHCSVNMLFIKIKGTHLILFCLVTLFVAGAWSSSFDDFEIVMKPVVPVGGSSESIPSSDNSLVEVGPQKSIESLKSLSSSKSQSYSHSAIGPQSPSSRQAQKGARGQKRKTVLKSPKSSLKTAMVNSIKNGGKTPSKKATVKSSKKMKKFVQIAKTFKFARKCKEEFANKKGLGEWGTFIKKELSTGRYPQLLKNNRAFQKICPGFKAMNMDERKNLWVLILMSMSHYESSCRPTVEAQGPHGTAKGLLQLHEGAEDKYSHWDRRRVCEKGDAAHPKESLQCTLSMLNGQVKQFNTVFYQGSYWDVLRNVNNPRTHASKIKKAIQMLPSCKNRSLAGHSPNPNIGSSQEPSQRL